MRSDAGTGQPLPLNDTDRWVPVRSSDGVTVALHDLGGADADEPVLLCHANGFCGGMWAPVAAHLPGWHALAPDLRGHGDAIVPPGHAYHWEGFADDVLAVVDHVRDAGIGSAPIVGAGHSMGGAALLLAEQRRPGTFQALYCYEPIVFPPSSGDTSDGATTGNVLAEAALRRRRRFDSVDQARTNFASKPPLEVFAPDALDAYVRCGFRPGAEGGIELKCTPEVESQVFSMGARHAGFDRLAAVGCPVTVACGANDGGGPASLAPLIADRLPAGRLEVAPDLGHFGPMQDPARIAAAIDRALR